MTLTTVTQYGQIARAMNEVQQHKPNHGEHSGRITCPRCGSGLRFVITSSGKSRGQCVARNCLRWCE
jgi:hypothetical protein